MSIDAVWYVMGLGLLAYVISAGADFGGGVWDLLASGPRKAEQRDAIVHAIAPIWEANHVWLIFVVVVMFTAFPIGFAAISVALHIPITLALIGIVLRGAAFTFRAYGMNAAGQAETWGRVFAISSAVTPLFLGMTLGALSTGAIRVEDGVVTTGFVAGWLTPFAFATGAFALALFALLAAVYLSAETVDVPELSRDFQLRTIAAELVAGALAYLVFARASVDAPLLFNELLRSSWAVPVQLLTAAAALTTIALVFKRRPRWARLSAVLQVSLVVVSWGLAMDRHLILPDLSIDVAGARAEVLAVLGPTLVGGGLILAPSLWYLFVVFKRARSA